MAESRILPSLRRPVIVLAVVALVVSTLPGAYGAGHSDVGGAGTGAPEVGSGLPELSLFALDGSRFALSERDGPTVLVFFRGVW